MTEIDIMILIPSFTHALMNHFLQLLLGFPLYAQWLYSLPWNKYVNKYLCFHFLLGTLHIYISELVTSFSEYTSHSYTVLSF